MYPNDRSRISVCLLLLTVFGCDEQVLQRCFNGYPLLVLYNARPNLSKFIMFARTSHIVFLTHVRLCWVHSLEVFIRGVYCLGLVFLTGI